MHYSLKPALEYERAWIWGTCVDIMSGNLCENMDLKKWNSLALLRKKTGNPSSSMGRGQSFWNSPLVSAIKLTK